MVCPYCSAVIPRDQPICPVCFASPYAQVELPRTEGQPQNLIIFMRSSYAEFYHSRVSQYLQPESVAWSFYASSEEAFLQITASSTGRWNLLIVDAATVQESAQLLLRFASENPNLVVGIEYEVPHMVPPTAPLPHGMMFVAPEELDSWLLLMHTLLTVAETP